MSMGIYGPPQIPIATTQFSQHRDQPQPQLPVPQPFFPTAANVSPASVPVQSVEGPSALDLGPQMTLQQPYDMHHSLRSIPEADRATSYHPDAVMHSIMAATAGASYMQPQSSGFSYDSNLVTGLPNDDFSQPAWSNVTESSPESYGVFQDYLQYAAALNTGAPADVQNSAGSISSEASPFSGTQSTGTTQSSTEPNVSSVASITSMFSGWTDNQDSGADMKPANDTDDLFEPPYNLPQASASEAALPFWGPNGQGPAFSQSDMYQHSNVSAHAVLSSPGHSERKLSVGPSEYDAPTFGDEVFTRRNSSTSNLANNIEAIHIQTGSPDDFASTIQGSSIAARRQKRPTALNSSTLRSASYSNGMPSPGNNSDHTLRRIRSSGITNAGRVQKPTPGSAQRSPMSLTFTDAASSPKFARTFSSSSVNTLGQGGSLAPPTPQTPNETGRFPYWQSNTVFRTNPPMPDHSSPESLGGANWSVEPSNGGSPSSTPLDLAQLNQARLNTDSVYRDTPPQSAPATQQTFPRTTMMQPPQMRHAFHSSTDLTLAQPKPNHFRRPSLPEPRQDNDANAPYNGQFDSFNYEDFKDFPLSGIQHNVPFAPPVSAMPDFLVHHYAPPQGVHGHMRRTTEPQARNYIFANQGPGDFRS